MAWGRGGTGEPAVRYTLLVPADATGTGTAPVPIDTGTPEQQQRQRRMSDQDQEKNGGPTAAAAAAKSKSKAGGAEDDDDAVDPNLATMADGEILVKVLSCLDWRDMLRSRVSRKWKVASDATNTVLLRCTSCKVICSEATCHDVSLHKEYRPRCDLIGALRRINRSYTHSAHALCLRDGLTNQSEEYQTFGRPTDLRYNDSSHKRMVEKCRNVEFRLTDIRRDADDPRREIHERYEQIYPVVHE